MLLIYPFDRIIRAWQEGHRRLPSSRWATRGLPLRRLVARGPFASERVILAWSCPRARRSVGCSSAWRVRFGGAWLHWRVPGLLVVRCSWCAALSCPFALCFEVTGRLVRLHLVAAELAIHLVAGALYLAFIACFYLNRLHHQSGFFWPTLPEPSCLLVLAAGSWYNPGGGIIPPPLP